MHTRLWREIEPAIDDHFQRLTVRRNAPYVQLRIIVAHGTNATEYGACPRAPAVAVLARFRSGNPLADAIVQCRFPVQTGSQLQPDPGTAARHARYESDVEFACFNFEQAAFGSNPGRSQSSQPAPCNLRIRILHGRHHTRHTGIDQCFGTRRRAAMMAARLERDIGCRTSRRLPSCVECMHFGMRSARSLMPAFSDDGAALDKDAADAWIGRCRIQPPPRQTYRLRHEIVVGRAVHEPGVYRERRGTGRDTSLTRSENSSTSSKLR